MKEFEDLINEINGQGEKIISSLFFLNFLKYVLWISSSRTKPQPSDLQPDSMTTLPQLSNLEWNVTDI